MKANIFLRFIVLTCAQLMTSCSYEQHNTVYLFGQKSAHSQTVENALEKYNIFYEYTTQLDKESDCLHILFDAYDLPQESIPKNYIVYQSYNIKNNLPLEYKMKQMANNYTNILKNAVAVWDFDRENIKRYSNSVDHYYYLPRDYEFADPVIIPCLLPPSALPSYKKILAHSNKVDTEISSLLPMIFYHSYRCNPKLILESGVCFGFSTDALTLCAKLLNSEIIGLDISKEVSFAYKNIPNSTFVCMDDTKFNEYYKTSNYYPKKFEVIFIDTSHEYNHTLKELAVFEPLLAAEGAFIFHDANVTPLRVNGRQGWWRINDTTQFMAAGAVQNPRGVAPAITKHFGVAFDETHYTNKTFTYKNKLWHLVHYPFCNGLTIIKRIDF